MTSSVCLSVVPSPGRYVCISVSLSVGRPFLVTTCVQVPTLGFRFGFGLGFGLG